MRDGAAVERYIRGPSPRSAPDPPPVRMAPPWGIGFESGRDVHPPAPARPGTEAGRRTMLPYFIRDLTGGKPSDRPSAGPTQSFAIDTATFSTVTSGTSPTTLIWNSPTMRLNALTAPTEDRPSCCSSASSPRSMKIENDTSPSL